jgi:hypothetical protein
MVTYYCGTNVEGERMNCYEHTDSVGVATCACGRGLCGACQAKRQPPTCDHCQAAAVAARIEKTKQRLTINYIFAVAYVIFGVAWLTGILQDGGTHPILGIAGLMVGVWGFLGFRWLLDSVLGVTRLTVFASGQSWLLIYIIGSICCSVGGFVLVPFEIVTQRRLLKQLREETGMTPAPTTAIGAVS